MTKDRVHSASPHTQPGAAPSDARLVAELQALTLALHIGGLDGLRSGAVRMGQGSMGISGTEMSKNNTLKSVENA